MVRTIEGTTVRIGISGAQSVGKTTLLNALRSEKCFWGYNIRNEVTRTVKSYGIDINENGSDISQMLIMKEHIYNLVMFDDMITDRTSLDGLVYTKWLYNQGKVSEDCFIEAVSNSKRFVTLSDAHESQNLMTSSDGDDRAKGIDVNGTSSTLTKQ